MGFNHSGGDKVSIKGIIALLLVLYQMIYTQDFLVSSCLDFSALSFS